MPIHDWTRVDAGLFHAFHHDWVTVLSRAERGSVAARLLRPPRAVDSRPDPGRPDLESVVGTRRAERDRLRTGRGDGPAPRRAWSGAPKR